MWNEINHGKIAAKCTCITPSFSVNFRPLQFDILLYGSSALFIRRLRVGVNCLLGSVTWGRNCVTVHPIQDPGSLLGPLCKAKIVDSPPSRDKLKAPSIPTNVLHEYCFNFPLKNPTKISKWIRQRLFTYCLLCILLREIHSRLQIVLLHLFISRTLLRKVKCSCT